MMTLRRARERGHANYGWLDTHYTFSFADYHDPRHMGFRSLRVINDDRIAKGQGFGAHPHREMEILTYVLKGGLQHRDSMGTGQVIVPGDVQRMSAGTGITHSEFNASDREPLHLLQIWLLPAERGVAPSYEQKTFPAASKRGRLCVIASPDARADSVAIHADAVVYAGLFGAGESSEHVLSPGRHAWLQVAQGNVRVNGLDLEAGDGASFSEEVSVRVEGVDGGEVLLFELA